MSRPADARCHHLLALCTTPSALGNLREEFAARGARLDAAATLAELRTAFFARGGHDLLIVTHDVPVTLAERAIHAVRSLDEHIPIVAFGHALTGAGCGGEKITKLAELHPASRAGIGAILRILLQGRD